MSWETIERYEQCKCGNPKGLKTGFEEDDWGQRKDIFPIIVCEKCKSQLLTTYANA